MSRRDSIHCCTGVFDEPEGIAFGEGGHFIREFFTRIFKPTEGDAPAVHHQLRQLGAQFRADLWMGDVNIKAGCLCSQQLMKSLWPVSTEAARGLDLVSRPKRTNSLSGKLESTWHQHIDRWRTKHHSVRIHGTNSINDMRFEKRDTLRQPSSLRRSSAEMWWCVSVDVLTQTRQIDSALSSQVHWPLQAPSWACSCCCLSVHLQSSRRSWHSCCSCPAGPDVEYVSSLSLEYILWAPAGKVRGNKLLH